MSKYATLLPHIESIDYADQFWNAARGKKGYRKTLMNGMDTVPTLSPSPRQVSKNMPRQ